MAAPAPQPSAEPAADKPEPVPAGGGSHPSGLRAAGVVGAPAGAFQVRQEDVYALSFSFYPQETAFRLPGDENLILRFGSAAGEPPSLALQLWDDGSGGRGLWSSGDAMGGERLLAPVAAPAWHELEIYFRASSEAAGFYLLFLDGLPVDARAGVSLIAPGQDRTTIEVGLRRDGGHVFGTSEVLFGSVSFDDAPESVLP